MHNRETETKKIVSWREKPVRPLKSAFTDLNRGWEEDGSGFEKEAKVAVKGIGYAGRERRRFTRRVLVASRSCVYLKAKTFKCDWGSVRRVR